MTQPVPPYFVAPRIIRCIYANMSFTLVGWASTTIAMYVAKADIQVGWELISLVSGIFAVCRWFGKASRRSPQCYVVQEEFPHLQEFQCLYFVYKFHWDREEASCQCEGSHGQQILHLGMG